MAAPGVTGGSTEAQGGAPAPPLAGNHFEKLEMPLCYCPPTVRLFAPKKLQAAAPLHRLQRARLLGFSFFYSDMSKTHSFGPSENKKIKIIIKRRGHHYSHRPTPQP
ncbi:unnamed protein product, partial [Prunus brigantina]